MAIYTVFQPRQSGGQPDPMTLAFVKEGFSWPALFFAEAWMIVSRMWLVMVLYVVAIVLIGLLGRLVGGDIAFAAIVLGHLLFALEGNELKRWTLRRRGYRFVDVVEARNEEEAEIRFFARTDLTAGAPDEPAAPPPRPPVAAMPSDEVVGLFPAPAQGQRP